MKSRTTARFWKLFDDLPPDVQDRAVLAYLLWQRNPAHGSLHFKRVSANQPLYSARVGLEHRVVGKLKGDTITWFWIGAHHEYVRLLS